MCVSSASTGLCGGCRVTGIPTATESSGVKVDDGAYAHQRLNLGTKGKAHGRNAKASNRT